MSDEKAKNEVRTGLELLNQARAAYQAMPRCKQGEELKTQLDKGNAFMDDARARFEHLAALLDREPERRTERPRGVPEDAEFDVVITAGLDGRVIEERIGKDGEAFESFTHDPDDAEKIGRDMIKGARLARLATKLDDDPGAG